MEFSDYKRVNLPELLATAVRLAGEGAVARVTWYGPGKEQYVTCEEGDPDVVREWFWDHCGDDFFSPSAHGAGGEEVDSDEEWVIYGEQFAAIAEVNHEFASEELDAIAKGDASSLEPDWSRFATYGDAERLAEQRYSAARWLARWFAADQAEVVEEDGATRVVYILIPLTVWLENARTEYELTPALARLLVRVTRGEEVADILEDVLTDEDIRVWHEDAEATDHVESLFDLFGPFDIWGSRTGNEPLTVVWPSAMEGGAD